MAPNPAACKNTTLLNPTQQPNSSCDTHFTPWQARIVALNAALFLKNEGHSVISIKANCIDSTAPAEHVFAKEVQKLQAEQFKPLEQLTLEPYERDHAVVVSCYRSDKAKKQKI